MNFKQDKVILIGEIGLNHLCDLTIIKRLIDACFACGWDAVKFQKRTPDICVPELQKYVLRDTPWGRIPYIDYRRKIELSSSEYEEIDIYCYSKPIPWSASVWDLPSLEFISTFEVPFIKIPSAKLTDDELLAESAICCSNNIPLILSTGMSTIDEIDHAVDLVFTKGARNVILLHTNSAYPAPPKDLNLRTITWLEERYGDEYVTIGYSGHEESLEPSVAAVALGAKVIERHITIDHNLWGTDQKASLEPHAMWMLRKRIDEVYSAMGKYGKFITDKEIEVKNKLRGE